MRNNTERTQNLVIMSCGIVLIKGKLYSLRLNGVSPRKSISALYEGKRKLFVVDFSKTPCSCAITTCRNWVTIANLRKNKETPDHWAKHFIWLWKMRKLNDNKPEQSRAVQTWIFRIGGKGIAMKFNKVMSQSLFFATGRVHLLLYFPP